MLEIISKQIKRKDNVKIWKISSGFFENPAANNCQRKRIEEIQKKNDQIMLSD